MSVFITQYQYPEIFRLAHFRDKLLADLAACTVFNAEEDAFRQRTLAFLGSTPDILDPFRRIHDHGGHLTSSMLVVNQARDRILLNHHLLSGDWGNFGGHMDGDTDVWHVAQKELAEEAGIISFTSSGRIFDIDIHAVAAHFRQNIWVPEHLHYDMMHLAVVPDDVPFIKSDESHDIRWFSLSQAKQQAEAIAARNPDKVAQLLRLYQKLETGWPS